MAREELFCGLKKVVLTPLLAQRLKLRLFLSGFPLSHSGNNNKPSVTFQMSRQHRLGLHS
jgi:hypothetical protein